MLHEDQVHRLPWAGAEHEPEWGQGQGGDAAGVQDALGGMERSAAAEQLAGDPWGRVCLSMGYPAEQRGDLGSLTCASDMLLLHWQAVIAAKYVNREGLCTGLQTKDT